MDPNKPSTDAPKFEFAVSKPAHPRRVRRARRPAASLPAAGEEKFIPKSAKPTRNQRFLRCHSDFLAEPSGWILRFLDVTKSKRPRQNYGLNI